MSLLLNQDEGGEADENNCCEAHYEGHKGEGTITVGWPDASEACHNPEVAVVSMRDCHCSGANSHYHESGSEG